MYFQQICSSVHGSNFPSKLSNYQQQKKGAKKKNENINKK